MNHRKHRILSLQAKFARKLIAQVKPVPVDIRKEVNTRFDFVHYSMLKAANECAKLPRSKLARLGRAFRQECTFKGQVQHYPWGNFYETKMLMMMAVCSRWHDYYNCNLRSETGLLRKDVLETMEFFHLHR